MVSPFPDREELPISTYKFLFPYQSEAFQCRYTKSELPEDHPNRSQAFSDLGNHKCTQSIAINVARFVDGNNLLFALVIGGLVVIQSVGVFQPVREGEFDAE